MRGRTRRKSANELQDIDPKGSPHLEEKLIGGNVDLDLLTLFPQDLARILGGSQELPQTRMALTLLVVVSSVSHLMRKA
jgi:hypothetical protein